MIETPEQRLKRIDEKLIRTITEIRQLNSNVEIESNRLVYYTISVIRSKIVIEKHTRNIYYNDDASKLIKYKYLTKNDAEQAILKILPMAQEKFNKCLTAYRLLTKEMGFSIDYNYDGDTYGIYNEYRYISFKMDDFYFNFEIE